MGRKMEGKQTEKLRIVPVILSGGTGTRLWPFSRSVYPKQFLPLASDLTLIQETLARVCDATLFEAPLIVCNAEHRFIVAEQLRSLDISSPTILLEPAVRNTAPALAAAAHYIASHYGDALMLVMPSDHIVAHPEKIVAAVRAACGVAERGYLVTFGITPEYAETGYGYIQRGDVLDKQSDIHSVRRFVEKPDGATAKEYFASKEYTWNSGMFLFSANTYLQELAALQPEMVTVTERAVKEATRDLDFIRLEPEQFGLSPALSVDYAVMEHTKKGAVVALDCGWSDAGSWDSLWNIAKKDATGNAVIGEVYAVDSENCYLRDDGVAIATYGVRDLVIVTTKDAVLVADRKQSQNIKKLVDHLKGQKPQLVEQHRRVYRPWGYYETIDDGSRHQVKRINVRPGAKLSLQMHHHRAEHWVVVSGAAKVTLDDKEHLLSENHSIYIPLGAKHRIENPGKIALDIIEVQSGPYLGEDDIVRFEDQYGRSKPAPIKVQ